MLALFLKNSIVQYNKIIIEKPKKEKKREQKDLIIDKSEIEEFLQVLEKNCEEAEKRRKQEVEISKALELDKKAKDTLNEFILYKPVEGTQMNILKNAIFNIARESGNASSKVFYLVDPLEIYQNFGKILHKVDEKMFDFDMKVTEYLVKIKYHLKKKELPFKSLNK